MERKEKVEKFYSRDVLWSPKVLAKILADVTSSKSHLISLFNLRCVIFQYETPLTASVTKEVRGTFNINEAIYTYGKWKLSHRTYSHLIAYCIIYIVLVFNPCLIRHCGLHIMVHMYMDVQLDDERIRVKRNPLVYIIRWILKGGTH
jgi:hypothetical protein